MIKFDGKEWDLIEITAGDTPEDYKITPKKKQQSPACKNCQYYIETSPGPSVGYCARYPPVLLSETHKGNFGDFGRSPMVYGDKWWGEFKPKK